MNLVHKLQIDLARKDYPPVVDAVEGDKFVRKLCLHLMADNTPWVLPENVQVLITYRKPDGKGGLYDTLPNGSSAVEIQENLVTITLAPQVLNVPGQVQLSVRFMQGQSEISTFILLINVQGLPEGELDSEDYCNIQGFLPQPQESAQPGQLLAVSSVDEDGKVTGLVPVGGNYSAGAGGYYRPSVTQYDDMLSFEFYPSDDSMGGALGFPVILPAGVSGVYVGNQEPPEDANVWIHPGGGEYAPEGSGSGLLACSSLGMTAEDANGTNFALLTQAMNQGRQLLVDGLYKFTAWERSTIDGNIHLVGKDLSCGFDLPGTGTLWDIGSGCGSIHMQGLKLTNDTDTLSTLFACASLSHRMQTVAMVGCHVEGRISPVRFYQADMDPETNAVGVDRIYVAGNTVKNNRASFLTFSDVSFNILEICGNTVENFDNVFCHSGVTNEAVNSAALTRQKKLYRIHDNTLICDDTWFHEESSSSSYYVFVLAEGVKAHYYRNHVEGVKSRVNVALYDAYLSCQEVLYEDNFWKNNCVFAETENNTLMKAKGNAGAEVGQRIYRNNVFIAEQSFYEKFDALDSCYLDLINNTSLSQWILEGNRFDLYKIKGFLSTSKMAGITFCKNTLRCDYWVDSYLLAGLEGAEIICRDNTITCLDGTFRGVRTSDYFAASMDFSGNRFTGCRFPLGDGDAQQLILQNNVFTNTGDLSCRLSTYGQFRQITGHGNRFIKSDGFFSPFVCIPLEEVDFAADTTVPDKVTNEYLLNLNGDTNSKLLISLSGAYSQDGKLQRYSGYLLLEAHSGYVRYTDQAGALVTASMETAAIVSPQVTMLEGETLPFTLSLRLNQSNMTGLAISRDGVSPASLHMQLKSLGKADFYVIEDAGLPEGYTQVEYIQSDGSQYIDTGVLASDYAESLNYTMQAATLGYANTEGANYLFGCLADSKRSGNVSFRYKSTYPDKCEVSCGGNSETLYWAELPPLDTLFALELKNVTAAAPYGISGSLYNKDFGQLSAAGVASDMPSGNIYLLKCNGSSNAGFWGRLYHFRMDKADGTALRDLVPCYRAEDGAIGLYDTVGGSFYTNAGSGEFTKGGDV